MEMTCDRKQVKESERIPTDSNCKKSKILNNRDLSTIESILWIYILLVCNQTARDTLGCSHQWKNDGCTLRPMHKNIGTVSHTARICQIERRRKKPRDEWKKRNQTKRNVTKRTTRTAKFEQNESKHNGLTAFVIGMDTHHANSTQ